MTSVHSLAARPPTQPKSAATGTADPDDAAAGDIFAALVAALLPEVTAITGDPAAGTGGDGTATPAATGAPVTAGVDVDLTVPAIDAGALAAAVGMPADGGSAGAGSDKAGASAQVAATAEVPSVPILAALTTNRPAVAAGGGTNDAGTLLAAPKPPAVEAAPVAADAPDAGDGDTPDGALGSGGPVSGAPKADAARRSLPASESEPVETDGTVPMHAAAPAPHQTAVHATERPTDAPAVTAAEPHQQLASVIKPLSRREDGTYHLALRLHPEHLGAVDVDVELHQGTVQVHVHTQHEETRELLLTHIDDLRHELEQAGLRAGMLDVSDRGQRQHPGLSAESRWPRSLPASGPGAGPAAAPITTTRPTTTATTDGAVDIQI